MRINRWKAIGTDKGQMEENQRVSLGLQKAIELMKKKHKERSYRFPIADRDSDRSRISSVRIPRSTSLSPYRFALSLKGPHKGSLKNPVSSLEELHNGSP
ncbi:hypothetical protein TNCV_154281 [Trichonephila clavipes]|nr:hypothetical protein TNCV_154281 [Trichonephila clavipes]